MMNKTGSGSSISKLWAVIGVVICMVMLQSGALANALGVPDAEYNALVALYNSTGGSNWTNRTNWLTETTPWNGVTVTNGHVTSIDLDNNNLTGQIPAEISNLTNLRYLYLSWNQLSGKIPAEIGNLSNLQCLWLSNNQLSGTIPAEIGNLTKLGVLNLAENQLTSTIPAEISNLTNLRSLFLDGNQLSGIIPAEIGNLTNLDDLRLAGNQLSGQIPVQLGNLTNLQQLFLDRNQLTGTIPVEFGNLTNLLYLALSSNQLSGDIPVEIGNLTNLQYLWLSDNQLTGTIPAEFGNLTNLRYLYLSWNQLSGKIPAEIGNLSNLQYLNFAWNQLSGDMPSSITNLTNSWIDLGFNSLSSADPAVISFLAEKDVDWQYTQTVPPTDVSAEIVGKNVYIEWTPIMFAWNDGYYEVGYSSTPGGPYTFDPTSRTFDKSEFATVITDLDISHPLYFVVRTVSLANEWNQSTLTSQLSQEVTGGNALGISETEYNALVTLYYSTDGDNWYYSNNWLTPTTPWDGVTVEDGHVTYLDLCDANLIGRIPVEISNLTNLRYLNLGWNQLSGQIPAELGNLTNLWNLELFNNQLSGQIPAELGNLTKLRNLKLYGNKLSGQIPAQLGNLANLQQLLLHWNQLTGTIPAEIGNLADLQCLYLAYNQFSGTIPTEIGNLTNLQELYLAGNQLSGDVPSSITNLTGFWIDLGYNALSSSDPAVISFLATKNNNWQDTQTVPPTDVSAKIAGKNVAVSWTPILFSGGDGYYEVGYSSTPGGPYTFDPANRAYGKLRSSLTLTGLDISHSVYFVVRTVSLAGQYNQSTLTSKLSQEVMLLVIPAFNKLGADGSTIMMDDMIVTASFQDFFYVEKQNRSWGIRVISHGYYPNQNERITITGTLHTNEDGERYVELIDMPPPVPQSATADLLPGIQPIYMNNRTLGGGNWFYSSESGAGQCGIDGGRGLNNIGLFVKTTGVVKLAGREWLYIDDGSGLDDGSGIRGLYVDARGYGDIPIGSVVWVTGISSCDRYNGRIVNTLLATNGGIISSPASGAAKPAAISAKEPANPRKH